jgi:Arc/MetJ-type ribon-helix-helix transcriptional regulator
MNVKVPSEIIHEIEKILKDGRLGYRSRAEFVIEAVRERILRIRETQARTEFR